MLQAMCESCMSDLAAKSNIQCFLEYDQNWQRIIFVFQSHISLFMCMPAFR
jgi:hypothetical protein